MKNKNIPGKSFNPRILIGIIMLIFVVVAGVFVLPKIAEAPEKTYPVYTLTKDVSAGTILTAEDIIATSTTDEKLAALAVDKADSIIGKTAVRDLSKNAYIYNSDLIVGEILLKTEIPEGKQIISFPISSIAMSVSYQLQADDIVRIFTLNDKGEAYVPEALQYIKIENVYDENGDNARASGLRPATVSFIVDQIQAEELVTIINGKSAHITLISRNDESFASTLLAEQDIILEKIRVKEAEQSTEVQQ